MQTGGAISHSRQPRGLQHARRGVAAAIGRLNRRFRLPAHASDLSLRRRRARKTMRTLCFAAALAAAALLGGLHSAAAQADLALVLAVDVSGSVSDDRFKLQ